MKTFDLIQMCLRNLIRRKYRTLLTLVGVVAGTCAVVLMIAVGLGMKASQEDQLAQMGDLTLIDIYSYGQTDKNGKKVVMDDKKIEEIRALPGVLTATPLYRPNNLNAQIFAGKNERYMTYLDYGITGVYPDSLPLLGYELKEGTWEDAFSSPYSIVLGEYGAYRLEDTRKKNGKNMVDPYPDRNGKIADPFVNMMESKLVIRLQQEKENAKKIEYKPKVTAIMKEDWGRDGTYDGLFMSITDIKNMEKDYIKANKIKIDKNSGNGYRRSKVKVVDINYVESVETAISDMGFDTWSMESIRKPMVEQTKKIQIFLGMIAGVSLFVAALGIINTMLMSVYERTREIGVMKVVGCHVSDIRSLFLMEAGCIGLLGGIIGICLSGTIAYLVNSMGLNISFGTDIFGGDGGSTQMFIITPWLVVLALLFSTFIGIVSGYYPANRAVKISALTAIKQD